MGPAGDAVVDASDAVGPAVLTFGGAGLTIWVTSSANAAETLEIWSCQWLCGLAPVSTRHHGHSYEYGAG